jgi:hypothetical protein
MKVMVALAAWLLLLAGWRQLLIVASGALESLPFAVLVRSERGRQLRS